MYPNLVFKNLSNPTGKSSKSDSDNNNANNHSHHHHHHNQKNQNASQMLHSSHMNKTSTVSSANANNLMPNQFMQNTLNSTSMPAGGGFNLVDKKSSGKKFSTNKFMPFSNSSTSTSHHQSSSSSSNESLLANLNARAVLFNNFISNSTHTNSSSPSFSGIIPSIHLNQLTTEPSLLASFGLNQAAAFTMATNEYFNRYLQSINQNIQYEKVTNRVKINTFS